ncbi:unnamed protein product [Prorocentrum cordatum]|uniref:DNA (cytosine-5-)-methyltransferase n=1 Tax=Prorocentrum cordatum TaxID=2364126 RepID=A0ABN9SP17_9DINO|nr:unnamed protein product [Polarella glacialis]
MVDAAGEDEVPADLSLVEPEAAALGFLVQVGRLYRCTAFDAESRPQGEYLTQVVGAYPPDEEGQFARAEQICCSDGYWAWWMAHPVERGGAGRPLYHFCAEEMRLATPSASRGTLIHVSEFEEVDAAEASEFYLECKAVDSWASWPEEFGPEPTGEAAARKSTEVALDEFGMPLDSCAVQDTAAPAPGPRPRAAPARVGSRQPAALQASPLEEAGARLSAVAPPVREAGDLRARLDRLRGALQPAPAGEQPTEKLREAVAGAAPARGGAKRPLEEVVQDRADKRRAPEVPAEAAASAASGSAGAGGEGPLLQLLLEAAASRSGTGDVLQSVLSGASGSSDGAVPRGLASRRGHFRQIAARFPGLLSEQALAKMSEYVTAQFPPIFLKYFLKVFIPQNPIKSIGIEVYREMRTVCEAADAILSGKTAYALDVLSQRFKALQLFAIDKSWSGARWLELIPPSNEQLALRTEDEEIVRTRTVQLREDVSKEATPKEVSWKAIKDAHPKRQGETRGAYGMRLRKLMQEARGRQDRPAKAAVTRAVPATPHLLDLGIAIVTLHLQHPGRLGKFCREFRPHLPTTGGPQVRTRDLLPMALPDLTLTRAWVASQDGPRRKRQRFRIEGRLVAREVWSYIVGRSLNFDYVGRGDPRLWRHSPMLHLAQRSAYKTIISHVDGFLNDPLTRRPDIDWSQKISKLRVDYTGEEQGEALPIKLAELIPGLPDKQHAAQLQMEEFVDEHILEWLMDPEVATLPAAEWPLDPPRARVNCERLEDWCEVAEHLIGLGILGVVDEADIFAPPGQKVFNGLFAREKMGKPLEGQSRCTRLIFNMIPSNAYLRNIVEDTSTLAASASWTSLHLPAGCVMVWSSDDQKGAFYVWKLPPVWYGRMAVSVPVPASSAGLPGDHLVNAAFRVIPMGWVLAVTLFQHLHRRLALRAPRLGAGLPAEAEWRRDQPWPLARRHPHAWWQVYIDDFDASEVLEAAEAYRVVGTPGEMQLAMRRAYTQAEVAYAEEKSHARQLQLERMGASIDGCAGTIRAPADKMIELVRYILHALGRDYCPWLLMLTLLGRAARALEFRRPLLSCLSSVWEFSTRTRGGRINMGMSQELLVCIGYLPIACTDLRAALSPLATVSDASEAGGGVCASTGLTPLAVQQLRAARQGARPVLGPGRSDLQPARSSPSLPGGRPRPRVLIVSLFDGVAALAVAVSRLPVDIIGMVCSEVDKPARRVVRLRWPGTADWGDIRSISEKDVAKLADTYYSLCDVCVCGAGSPCQDLSAVNLSRAGLAGPSSKLFYETPRAHGLLRKHFKEKLATFVGNVASMSPQVRDAITKELGVPPVKLCSSIFVPARRPRYYWCNWPVQTRGEFAVEELRQPSGSLLVVRRVSGSVAPLQWVAAGWTWGGGAAPVPTLVCPRPASSRAAMPAGLRSASDAAKRRWEQDCYRYHLGWYEETSMLRNDLDGSLRAPNPEEREALLGFDKHYTRVAHKDPGAQGVADTRSFLLGNSYSVYSVSWLLQQLFLARGLLARELPAEALFARGACPLAWGEVGTYTKGAAEYDKKLASEFTGEEAIPTAPEGPQTLLQRARKAHSAKRGTRLKLLRVTSTTLHRYRATAKRVLDFWDAIGLKPSGPLDTDEGIAEYIEMLWSEGQPVSFANYAVVAIGFFFPSVKQSLGLSWGLLKAWRRCEPHVRALPFTPELILGMAALAIECDAVDIGTLLALGFAGLLRTTELFTLSKQQVAIINDRVIVRLPETKTGYRKATTEMVVVDCPIAVDLVKRWHAHAAPPDTISTRSPAQLRSCLKKLLAFFHLEDFRFSWYSCRRGGAACDFIVVYDALDWAQLANEPDSGGALGASAAEEEAAEVNAPQTAAALPAAGPQPRPGAALGAATAARAAAGARAAEAAQAAALTDAAAARAAAEVRAAESAQAAAMAAAADAAAAEATEAVRAEVYAGRRLPAARGRVGGQVSRLAAPELLGVAEAFAHGPQASWAAQGRGQRG